MIASSSQQPTVRGLTKAEHAILDFEKGSWKSAAIKEENIRETFGISATRYYQILNRLLDNPAALVSEPLVVNRLRRMRDQRRSLRRGYSQ
ncbi:MAG: DUF3263 domain-containing protein [Propionibacteriaceae bacterium]